MLCNVASPMTDRFSKLAARFICIWVVGIFLLALACSSAAQTKGFSPSLRDPNKPNIIFILADDLGYGDLGCYGQKKIQTPHIDRLAAEGIRFTQFYAGSTVCAPSRACLMTGYHTGHARIRGNDPVPLRPEDVTVAETLREARYKTAVVGKWGMGLERTTGIPTQQGFDEWFGYLSQNHAHDYYPTQLWRNEMVYPLEENHVGQKVLYSHDLFTMVASNYVRVTSYFPFFLYLAYTVPHANNELGKVTGNGMEIPSDAPYSKEDWPQTEKNMAAMITRLDRDVGALVAQLKNLQIDHNTAIFFTSDNGPHKEGGVDPAFFQSSGPLRGIKRDFYEGGIRVPMIVRWPGKIQPSQVSDQIWTMWDFLPTAAEMAGLKPPTNIDGISMLPTLLGQKQTNQHDFLYWEFHEKGFHQAARTGPWKAIRRGLEQPLEIYNLQDDIGETNNVANLQSDVAGKFLEYFKSARTESEYWPKKKLEPETK